VLARVDGRTVAGWARVKADIDRYYALKKKAAAGDENALVEVALFECRLGRIDFDTLEERLEGRTLNAAQKAKVRALELDVEVRNAAAILRADRRSKDAYRAVGEDLAAAFEAGEAPASPSLHPLYWSIVARYGLIEDKPDLARKAVDRLAERFGEDDRRVKSLRKQLPD